MYGSLTQNAFWRDGFKNPFYKNYSKMAKKNETNLIQQTYCLGTYFLI